jgi:levansucrase
VLIHPTAPYLPADDVDGGPGRIRAFRDPGWFRDPADGREYLLVAASVPWEDRFTGAVALVGSTPAGWELLPPLLVADGVNHELERPHVVVHDSRYYLFVCTSRGSFHPEAGGPTGLYGFVAPTLAGPYEPLNGSGLVVANPAGRPDQAYAWLVLPDLRVESFVNYLPGQDTPARARFGGTAAPTLTLALGETGTEILRNDEPGRTAGGRGDPVGTGSA